MAIAGPYPVYGLKFKIGTKGAESTASDMVEIADMETFDISIDGNVESWTPFETNGWSKAMMTGKTFSVSVSGKRSAGDIGNDYVASMAWKDGLDCTTKAEIVFQDGSKLSFDCVVNVTSLNGGEATTIAPLEFELTGNGQPVYTAA